VQGERLILPGRKSKTKSEERKLGNDRWYNQMEQVEKGWSTWDRWNRDREFSKMGGTGWDWNRGVFRLGATGWNSGHFSVQLNQSTCIEVGLQA